MAAELEFINREVSLENMILAQSILRKHGVDPFLHYGTLLGAVREKDFIPHDDDVDFGIFGRDRKAFTAAFPDLVEAGFSIVYLRDSGYGQTQEISDDSGKYRMFKFRRKDQELDFFMAFEKRYLGILRWDIDGRVTIPGRFLSRLDTIDFLGHEFSCPFDRTGFLKNLYGKTWNVPIRDTTSRIGWLTRLRKIKNISSLFFYMRRYFGEKIRKHNEKKNYTRNQS